MDTKSLSSRRVRLAQELSRNHFRIDYRKERANAADDALSRFLHRSQAEEETLRAENSEILHRLQSSLINASLADLSLSGDTAGTNFSPLHQVLICGNYVLPRLCQFWKRLRGELASEGAYQASVGSFCLRLPEIYAEDQLARRIRDQGLKDGWEKDVDRVLHHQRLPYVPEVIRTELLSRHHNDLLAGHFGINKTRDLIARKYYWPSLQTDV